MSDREATQENERGVTVSVSLRIEPGRESEFDDFLAGITDAAEEFPGFLSVQAYRPPRGRGRHRVLLRFDSNRSRERWRESPERRIWEDRADDISEGRPRVADITGTSQEQPLALALGPLQEFVRTSVSGIGLLLLGAAVALIMANSHWVGTYERFWNTQVTIGSVDIGITTSLRHWVNDALMALFFFILGLEIKREVLVGELREVRQAALPIAAAIGGGVVPASIYALINIRGDALHGWGIPIGTDTAFALGILSLLGSRVPTVLVVFLTASSIVDDIIAVAVIAIFYTDNLNVTAMIVAVGLLALLMLANRAGFHRWYVYGILGVGVWLAVFESGVHGTIAGVLVAMVVPARSWINAGDFVRVGRRLIDDFEASCSQGENILSNQQQQIAAQRLDRLVEGVETPMSLMEHGLAPWVSYLVLPIFAFANAGIPLRTGLGDALGSTVTWGVILGLLIGKPIGITLFSWLSIRSGIAQSPPSTTIRDIFGVAGLAGIGFTMSLFITELAFGTDPAATDARIGVIIGSIVSGSIGFFALSRTLARNGAKAAAASQHLPESGAAP
ncbi:MAG TPA: Na+/H+ antiporter NhaA [Thermomicrobiales bacterium]|nr:Na+/H+ antiporter NhaA [Thermomicrobiales bacterium]